MAGPRLAAVLWAWACCRGWARPGRDFAIINAAADIEELDVGDLDDMDLDVTRDFREKYRKRKSPKPPKLQDMQNPMDWALGNQAGMLMSTAFLTWPKTEELGKEGTERLSKIWKSKLDTGSIRGANVFTIEAGRILFTTEGPGVLPEVKRFVLSQPDVDWYELQSQKFYPEGRSAPLMTQEDRRKREIELGWKPPPKPRKDPKAAKPKRKKRRRGKTEEGS